MSRDRDNENPTVHGGSINVIDSIVRYVDPERAVRRAGARELLNEGMRADGGYPTENRTGAYDAAVESRFRIMRAWGPSLMGDEGTSLRTFDRHSLMLELRWLFRNDEIIHGLVNRFQDYVVGQGITPQAQTSSKPWNQEAEDYWNNIVTRTADFRNRDDITLIDLDRICIASRYLDGDCFFVMLANGQLQPVEAELIQTPASENSNANVRDGVKKTDTGIIISYFVCERDKYGYPDRTKAQEIPRQNMIHVHNPFFRFDQVRGVPGLAAVINKVKDHGEADKYLLNKFKLEQMNLMKLESQTGDAGPALPYRSRNQVDANSNVQNINKLEWGMIWKVKQGEKAESMGGVTPTPGSIEYLTHELELIAPAVGLPYEYLMMMFTKGSFSAQRAAMIHAQHTFVGIHDWLCRGFKQRHWNWRIAKAMKEGDLPKAPVDKNGVSEWYKVDWAVPYFGWVDIEAQTNAEKMAWNMGKTSLKQIVASMGRDRDDVAKEKGSDIEMACDIADAINKAKPGAGVTWRDIINTMTPGVSQGQAKLQEEEKTQKDGKPSSGQPEKGGAESK